MNIDRAVAISFSMRLSTLGKLEKIIQKTGIDRSKLLDKWISQEFEKSFPQPVPLDEELNRR